MAGKLIAVSGPPGCGKTTLALKLAQAVHELTKKKIVFISPDTMIPSMGVIFPKRPKESLLSLGTALENVNLSISNILGVIATTKAMPNLGYLGYIPGEGPYSYAALQEQKVMDMFEILRENFDYIFVDCTRDREDLISSIGVGLSDHLIQVINPDIKSIAYYGFEPLQGRAIQVLNVQHNDLYMPIQDTKAHFSDIRFTVMYSRMVKMQMVEGELMDPLKDAVYQKAIAPIVNLLLASTEAEPEQTPEEDADTDSVDAEAEALATTEETEGQPSETPAETDADAFWN